jgi:hypothetical protein
VTYTKRLESLVEGPHTLQAIRLNLITQQIDSTPNGLRRFPIVRCIPAKVINNGARLGDGALGAGERAVEV